MSEEAKPVPAEPAKTAEGAPAAGAPAKAAPLWMLALVVILPLAAGGALGSLLIAPKIVQARQAAYAQAADSTHGKHGKKKDKKKDKHAGKEGEGKPTSYKIENIVVNPADSQGQRFLMCSLAIESDDPKSLDTLRDHEVELRDKIVSLLTSLTLEQLTAVGARDSLRIQLERTIHPVLGEDGEGVELKVYLPNFVIQ